MTKAMLELADYLDRLEAQLIASNSDMLVDEETPPSVWADRIRSSQNNGDSGERERVIEECAKRAENFYNVAMSPHLQPAVEVGKVAAKQIAASIRALKSNGDSGEKGSVERVHPDVPPYGDQS